MPTGPMIRCAPGTRRFTRAEHDWLIGIGFPDEDEPIGWGYQRVERFGPKAVIAPLAAPGRACESPICCPELNRSGPIASSRQ